MFFEANDITSETKTRALLLTSMGKKAYTTLRSYTEPKNACRYILARHFEVVRKPLHATGKSYCGTM